MLDGRSGAPRNGKQRGGGPRDLGEPQDFLRERAGEGAWSVLWKYGALQLAFDQR